MNCIYLLRCPLSGAVRYIGQSTQPRQRLYHHVHAATKYNRDDVHCRWIRRLVARKQKPELHILYRVPPDADWGAAEHFFIASAKCFGFRMTNVSLGGRGVGALPADIERQRLAKSHAAMSKPGMFAKRGAAIKASWDDPDCRAKRIAALKANAATPERRAKLLAAARIPRSAEAKARRAEGIRRYWQQRREAKNTAPPK